MSFDRALTHFFQTVETEVENGDRDGYKRSLKSSTANQVDTSKWTQR